MNFSKQGGQALILMIAFTLILSVALVYLFNTSQVLAERTQAKVLADHAAYNTAVKQAQLLNANAYMNKAKIANQLATAQAVSVASWVKHFEPMPQNTKHISLIPYVGPEIQEAITTTAKNLQPLAETSGPYVVANNAATYSISLQQNLLNTSSIEAIEQVHGDTLSKSSIGSGFESTPMITASKYVFIPSGNRSGNSFIQHYAGNSNDPYIGRQRLKRPLLASRDNFTRKRRADNTTDFRIPLIRNKLQRRGGTEISTDLNQWKGVDTFSHHYRKLKRWRWRKIEDQIGYGSAVSRVDGGDSDRDNHVGYDNARKNKDASRLSVNFRPKWDSRSSNSLSRGETGIPQFWDLDAKFLKPLSVEDPTLPISIRVRKSANKLDTTSGISAFKVGDTLNIESKNTVTAVSTAEVYFERPLQDRQGRNTYLNKNKLEKGSLFNPYWSVRLTDNSRESIIEARAR